MDSEKPPESAPTNAPSAPEPSGPIGRLSHDHLDLDAEERRHRREKRGGQPVMAIILGLTLITAIVFYVLHLRAVAKEEADAKQRAAAAAAAAEAAAKEAQKVTPPPPPQAPAGPATGPATAEKGATPAQAKPTTDDSKPAEGKPAAAKPAEAKPAAKTDKPARPAKKADDKTKSLPRLPVLPEG